MMLQDLGTIAGIVGSVAVVVSLVRNIASSDPAAFQSWWGRQRRFFDFDPAFVALVDERIARTRET